MLLASGFAYANTKTAVEIDFDAKCLYLVFRIISNSESGFCLFRWFGEKLLLFANNFYWLFFNQKPLFINTPEVFKQYFYILQSISFVKFTFIKNDLVNTHPHCTHHKQNLSIKRNWLSEKFSLCFFVDIFCLRLSNVLGRLCTCWWSQRKSASSQT